jgi:hypothetical protein
MNKAVSRNAFVGRNKSGDFSRRITPYGLNLKAGVGLFHIGFLSCATDVTK